MSTIANTVYPVQPSAAHVWYERHLAELTGRCQTYFRGLPLYEREEATAETLASVLKYAIGAAARGKLQLLTPYTLVLFFGRAFLEGRRMAGSSTVDVMSEAAQRKHGFEVISLNGSRDVHTPRRAVSLRLSAGISAAPDSELNPGLVLRYHPKKISWRASAPAQSIPSDGSTACARPASCQRASILHKSTWPPTRCRCSQGVLPMTDEPREPAAAGDERTERELCELLARLLARRWIESKRSPLNRVPAAAEQCGVPDPQEDSTSTS